MEYSRKWEQVDNDTYRMRVPGGWIVTHEINIDFTSMIFLPDKDGEWNLVPIKEPVT